MGYSHRLPNRYRGNAYANRYPSNNPINRISMVTNNRNKTCIVASSVFTWVRHKAVNETTQISDKRKEKVKSGHGPQRGARHQDILTD
jgi:hypothetical protein